MTEIRQEQQTAASPAEQPAPPGLIARSALAPDELRPEHKRCYAFRGGMIAFIDHDDRLYITPGTRTKLELLQSLGFANPRPQFAVPFSDGSIKSKRWLRQNLPPGEIQRSLRENDSPKLEARVAVGLLKITRDGIGELDPEFVARRCARAEGKFYQYIGLCASYRGVFAFTDNQGDSYVTPFSEPKRELLEAHGYVFVGQVIRVPYSLESEENRTWLATHLPRGEWSRTEQEIAEWRDRAALEQARRRIEELGLKEIPPGLLSASACCEEPYRQYAGMVGAHNGILSFTDPLGATWVTPATREKTELLKELGYQFMGSTIKVPYSLKTVEDVEWLKEHIAPEHWSAARAANQAELRRQEEEQTERRRRSLGLKELPSELTERSVGTGMQQVGFAGQFSVRNNILAFIDPAGEINITPLTRRKLELLEQVGYKRASAGIPVPYSGGTPADREYLRRHLSPEELEESRRELESEEQTARREKIERMVALRKLQPLPEELLQRAVPTPEEELELIGCWCSRGGVTAFVHQDGRFHVTPTTAAKERMLREAGYRPPERLIRVPYGSGTREDLQWLEQHLPAGELERSRRENTEQEQAHRADEIRRKREQLGLAEKLPEELTSRSALTGHSDPEQLGRYLIQKEWIGIVGPDSQLWITPNTPSKVELLLQSGYEHATKRFPLPCSSDSEEDRAWRAENLPQGELERCRQELAKLERARAEHAAEELKRQKALKPLPEEFLARCLRLEPVAPRLIGNYNLRKPMLYFIDQELRLSITPWTPAKQKALIEAGYTMLELLPPLPHTSGNEQDLAWIGEHLPAGELEHCRAELAEGEREHTEARVRENMEKLGLKALPEGITARAADSGLRDPRNVGRLGIYRGVLAVVAPDERVFVTWYTPDKQEALEELGYRLEGRLPIKVPSAMPNPQQRQWLLAHLPDANEDEALSVEENGESR